AILAHKVWQTYQARKLATQFYQVFQLQKQTPLNLDCDASKNTNPFQELYIVLKKHTVDILNKNRHFSNKASAKAAQNQKVAYLSPSDIDFVEAHLATSIANQTKDLEKNLFILATIVSLAPFLGLLGTVWGILTTFSELQMKTSGSAHQMVL